MTTSHRPVTHRRRALVLAAASAVVALGLTACSDDEPDEAGDAGEAEEVDLAAYCDSEVAQDQFFQTVDADAPGFQESLEDGQIVVDAVVSAAPEELAGPIGVRAEAYDAVRKTGDPEAFFTEAVLAADAEVHEYDLDSCDWQRIDIDAADYTYAGDFPTTAGTVSFELANTGEEPHLLLVARKKADVAGDAVEVFSSLESEEAMMESFDMVASTFAAPGEDAKALADLEAGDYVAFCPLPVGSSTDGEVEGGGPPHFTQGMITGFEVAST